MRPRVIATASPLFSAQSRYGAVTKGFGQFDLAWSTVYPRRRSTGSVSHALQHWLAMRKGLPGRGIWPPVSATSTGMPSALAAGLMIGCSDSGERDPGCRSKPGGSDDLGDVAVGVFADAVEDGGGHPQDRAAEIVRVPINLGVEEVKRCLLRV